MTPRYRTAMLTEHPVLPIADARAVLAHAQRDPQVHAGVVLLLLAGLRPAEVEVLRVASYSPGREPRLRTGTERHPRTIRIAPSAAAALDAYLSTESTDAEDFLLPGLRAMRLVQVVRGLANAADVQAGVHDLRRSAMAAVLEDGTPVRHAQVYFGVGGSQLMAKELGQLPAGYDASIADVLERTFA